MAMSYLDYRVRHREHQNEKNIGKPKAGPATNSTAGPSASAIAKGAGKADAPAPAVAKETEASAPGSFLDYKVQKRQEQVKQNGYERNGTYRFGYSSPLSNKLEPKTPQTLFDLSQEVTVPTEIMKNRMTGIIAQNDDRRAKQEAESWNNKAAATLGGTQTVGDWMHEYLNDPALNKTYDADTVNEYNRIYDSEGAGAAQKYIMSKSNTNYPGMERVDAALLGAANGTGLASLAGIASTIAGRRDLYGQIAGETQRLSNEHPIASTAGAIAGNVALLSGIGAAIKSIPALANLSGVAKTAATSAASMAGGTAVQELGAAAAGYIKPSQLAKDVAVSGAAGAAGGVVSNAINKAGGDFLWRTGLLKNTLARTAVAGISSAGYSLGSTGVREGAAYVQDPEKYQADPMRIIKDATVAFAFGAISYIASGGNRFTMNEDEVDPNRRPSSKYFSDCNTPKEIDAKLRQYARQYHPDQPNGDAQIFADISAEATAQKAWMNINAGAQAYQKAQDAQAAGDTEGFKAAKEEFDTVVNELSIYVENGEISGREAVEAVQILQAVSENLSDTVEPAPDAPASDIDVPAAAPEVPAPQERVRSKEAQEWLDEIDRYINEEDDIPQEPVAEAPAEEKPVVEQDTEKPADKLKELAEEAFKETTEPEPPAVEPPVKEAEAAEKPAPVPAPQETAKPVEAKPDAEQPAPVVEDTLGIDYRAKAYPEGAAEIYKKHAEGIDDILSYDENMRKAYEAGKDGVSLVSTMENDDAFGDFYTAHQDAVDEMFNEGYKVWINRKNAPLNPPAADSKIESTNQETQAPVERAPEAPALRTEFATKEAEKLSSDLVQRKRVDQNGFRYTISGDSGNFFGSVDRIGEPNIKNARDTVYRVGPKATVQEIADDLAAVAENNHFLEEADNGRLGDEGTGNGSSQGGVLHVGRGSEGDGTEGTGEARPVSGRGVGENGRSEQGESESRTGRDKGTSGKVTEEKPAENLPAEAKKKIEEGVPETAATTSENRPAKTQAEIESKRAADIPPKGTNYVIPAEGLKLPNSEKARYKSNVAAIQTLRTLMQDNRQATPEEQTVLSQYVGWGGLKSVFDEKNEKWQKEFKQLKELLSKEEYDTAKGSVLNAHYTDVGVIRAIYTGLKGMGFKGGRIMEPAAGVGHFAGAMPSDINVQSLTMVELDNITGNIAKYLYPNADVRVQGFEKAVLPDNYMDLAISNVPFGDYSIFDKSYPKTVTRAIHNYFFAKSIDKVRPGGLVCFITSRFTMDAKDPSVRDYIMKRADLVGAIRLPDTAFKSNAGTEVVTDIIVLKKREAGTPYGGEAFKRSDYYHSDQRIWDPTNEYFQNHPEMVLGVAESSGTMYRSNSLTYKAKPGDLSKQIEKAFSTITAKMEYPDRSSGGAVARANREEIRKASGKTKNGSYVKQDGKIYKNENGELVEATLKDKTAQIIGASIDLRDTARQLLDLQLNNGDAAEIDRLRKKLNTEYDSFVKQFGPLNKTTNRTAISSDADSPFIFALENYNPDSKVASKADIFTKNTVSPHKIVEHVESMEDGLAASLNDSGTVDVSLIARVTGKSEADTTRELIDQKLAFKTKDGGLQSAQQYLAGNVRAKLKEARALALIDKDFQKNVEELERVVPKDIEPSDISVKPGATWIPPEIYADFAAEMLGTNNKGWQKEITVTYVPAAGVYKVDYGRNGWSLKRNSFSVSEYGTDRKTFVEIFEATLNNKDLKVYFPHDKDEKPVIDQQATIAVKEKKRIILQKFQEWMWSDSERVKTYAPLYNDIFNNSAIPNYDGSKLKIEGLSSGISLREHQSSAVQRIIMSGGNTLLAHGTGSGKTLEMAAAAMKLRQIGAVKKPMFVVPKNILGQWGNEFYSYFPNAKILLPGEKDFTPGNRKAFINKVTTGDWDAVIVSYEQFYKIPMSQDAQKGFYQRQIDEIIAAQQAARETEGKKGFTVSALEKKRKQLQAKLEYLNSGARDEDNINFESLGVDSLFVDEAHNFKNLFYNTQLQNVSDLGDQTGSERAFDLYSKVRYLQSVNGGRGIVFATATPVMNSVVEMYTMQRYLQGDLLEQKGINNFDAWVNEFGDVQEVQKIKSDGGGYETRTSLSRYRNLGELQQMFRSFADVVTNPPGLAEKLPKLRGGAPIVVECNPTDAQRSYLKELGKRSEKVRHSRDLKEDNILKIYSDGKKMSYTQRMIDSSLPYEQGGKILESVSRILKEYKDSTPKKGVQLVFCDTGVIGSNAKNPLPLWTDIKDLLVKGGIPENEIDFAKSGMTDKQKQAMMKKANDGTTRVLIGSTKTMGTGLNVQKHLVGMHEINCPDRPGDVDQNRGRLIRQGNTNKEVFIYTYITKETFDSRQWDNQKRKSAFIHQAIAGDVNGRTADGDGEFSMSAAEISAIASGNPLIMEWNEVSTKISQYEALEADYTKRMIAANRKLSDLPRQIERIEQKIKMYKADAEHEPDLTGDNFFVTIGNVGYSKRADAGQEILNAAKEFFSVNDDPATKKIGKVGDFDILVTNRGDGLISLNGQYDFSISTTPSATIQSLVFATKSAGRRIHAEEDDLKEVNEELKRYQDISNQKFEHADELKKLRAREAEIMEVLNPSHDSSAMESVADTEEANDAPVRAMKNSGGKTSTTEQWTAKRVGDTNKAPKPISDIIAQMRHDFGFNVTVGHIRRSGVQGTFNIRDKGIRTRIANNLPTVSHEFGHWLDDKYGITSSKEMPGSVRKELEAAFNKVLGANGEAYAKKDVIPEGMAEYIRQYLQNREVAAIDYPELTKYVLGSLDPNDLAKLSTFADEINAYYSLDAGSAASSIRLKEQGGPDFRTRGEKLQDANDKFQQAWIDSNYSIKRFTKENGGDAYTYAVNSAYSDAVAARLLEGDLTDIHGQYVSGGLRSALHGINTRDPKEYIAFNEYLIVRHGPEWLATNKRVFADDRKNSTLWMNQRRMELEAQYPEFEAASERLYEFIRNFTQTWGVDTGLISQETMDALNEQYPNYVPFNRAVPIERRGKGVSRGFANQRSPLRAARGSGLDIIAPVDNIIDMVVTYTNVASRNRVMQAMRNVAIKEGDATWMEKVPMPIRKQTFNMGGVKETLREYAFMGMADGNIDQDAFKFAAGLIDQINDDMVKYVEGFAKGDVVTVMVDGKREYWKINDPGLLESLTNLSNPTLSGLLSVYARTSRFLTMNLTGNNPIWGISNLIRDYGTYSNYTPNRNLVSRLSMIGETYVNAFKNRYRDGKGIDPIYYEYLAMGGGTGSAYTADINLAERVRNEYGRSFWKRAASKYNPVDFLSFMMDTIEQGPRFATYKYCRTVMGMSPEDSLYASKDVTVNFRKFGTMGRQMNAAMPFSNAAVQGLDKMVRYFSAEDVNGGSRERSKAAAERWSRWVAGSVIAMLVPYLWNKRNKESREAYTRLSNYTKNNYFCWYVGNDRFLTLPKPRELASITTALERTADYAQGDQFAFKEFDEYVADAFFPDIISDIAQIPGNIMDHGSDAALKSGMFQILGDFGIAGVAAQVAANKNFLESPIESQANQNLLPKDRYTGATSKMAYWIGRGLGLSPQSVDHFAKNTLGYMWKIPAALFTVDPAKSDLSLGMKNSYVRDSLYSNDIVNRMYEEAEWSAMDAKSNPNDGKKQVLGKLDSNMTSFYGTYNALEKAKGEDRTARRDILRMIDAYQRAPESKATNKTQEMVYDLARRTRDTDLLPGVMTGEVKDSEGKKHQLSPAQYIRYQKEYDAQYWKGIEQNVYSGAGVQEKTHMIEAVKELAKQKALKYALGMVGAEYKAPGKSSMAYFENGGTDLGKWTEFDSAIEAGNQDGGAEWLNSRSDIGRDEALELWLSYGYAEKTFDKKVNK